MQYCSNATHTDSFTEFQNCKLPPKCKERYPAIHLHLILYLQLPTSLNRTIAIHQYSDKNCTDLQKTIVLQNDKELCQAQGLYNGKLFCENGQIQVALYSSPDCSGELLRPMSPGGIVPEGNCGFDVFSEYETSNYEC